MAISPWVTWPALTKYGTLGVMAGALVIGAEREELLKNNLFAVEDLTEANAEIVCDERSRTARTENGTCNILENPAEGAALRRFGRNVELSAAQGETDTLMTPNPREVSNVLMARGDEFKPVTSLNFIAAAWIQFMVHDWFDHGPGAVDEPMQVPLPAGDAFGSGALEVRRTVPDPTRTDADAHLPTTYRNINTHWWDGSQLYGSSKEANDKIRAFVDGKLIVESDKTLPTEMMSGKPITGFNENWWVGLSMLHQLFTLEHNAIASMLKQKYPNETDQWLYDRARLINSALMAKIHTVEWTPAIIANPVTETTMYANWWGIGGDRDSRDKYQESLDELNANLSKVSGFFKLLGIDGVSTDPGFIDHALGGLVGSRAPVNSGTDYTLTEEFVAVYRMHPLLRDEINVYDIGSNVVSESIPLEETRDGNAEDILDDVGSDRLWYSFGITHPGALTLKNYPEFLRNLSPMLAGNIDLATTDILRDRERGVPRYNEFRRQIGLKPITKFEDLTTDPEILAELKRLYNNDIEMIDTLVGQLAETVRPEGFGFGETAFQIFILNASRRLMTDRFYTSDYRPEVYTQEGIDWVENNTMVDVIKRHYPNLSGALVGMENAFKPWGLNMPDDYETWSGAAKQDHLWINGALRTQYKDGELPALKPVDALGLIDSILWTKVKERTDVAPPGYEKPIHPYGVMAKARFVPTADHGYTGLFQGSENNLLRLSVTGEPSEGFAPGLAWKALVDGKPSENVSALYTLSGQGDNHNFFANTLSQYVLPEANSTIASTLLFSAVSTKPTLLMMNDMAEVKQDGTKVTSPKAPTQIYFVPNPEIANLFDTTPHDFREDLMLLGEGIKVYDIYATSMEIKTSIFPWVSKRYAEERRNSAKKIGEMVLTSPFIASHFGDSGVFFKHQRYEDR